MKVLLSLHTNKCFSTGGVKLPEDISLEVNWSVLYFSWRQVDFKYAEVFTYNSITKVNVSDGVISYNLTELIDYIRISLSPNGRYYSQFSVGRCWDVPSKLSTLRICYIIMCSKSTVTIADHCR